MSRQKTFSVVEPQPGRYYVCTYEQRKRVYVHPDPAATVKHFPTRKKAESAAKALAKHADVNLYRDLTPEQRREYWELVAIARDHDMRLREAVERGVGKSGHWPELVSAHTAAFLEHCRTKKQLAESSVGFYEQKLKSLFASHPQSTFGDWPAWRLKNQIKSFGNGIEWEKGAVRTVSAFWNWGFRQHPPISPHSITKGIDLDHPAKDRQIEFITIEELAAFLYAASLRWCREAFALMAFAGLRKSEAEQMRWEWINVARRTIHVPAHVSKTRAARIIETAPDVLWSWLTPESVRGRETLAQGKLLYSLQVCAEHCGVPKWPQSGLRHTMITYHYAAYRDAAATRAISGHDEDARTLEQRYRGVSTQRHGATYLATEDRGREWLLLTPDRCTEIARACGRLETPERLERLRYRSGTPLIEMATFDHLAAGVADDAPALAHFPKQANQ